MSEGRWRISVTAPDWGEDHLTLDAIVAFVDEELEPGPRARAARHVARCSECAAQVIAQTQARVALRTAPGPRLPSSLLSSLRSIPEHTDLPAPPNGLAVSEDGQLVCRTRPDRPQSSSPQSSSRPPSRPSSRRSRFSFPTALISGSPTSFAPPLPPDAPSSLTPGILSPGAAQLASGGLLTPAAPLPLAAPLHTDPIDPDAIDPDAIDADAIDADLLGPELLDAALLDVDGFAGDGFDADSLCTDSLCTDSLGTDSLGTDSLGTDSLGTGSTVVAGGPSVPAGPGRAVPAPSIDPATVPDLPVPDSTRPRGRRSPADSAEHGRRRPVQQRIRVSTGVAVSGLALGALAFGATAAAPGTAPVVERGVFGGTVLGGPAVPGAVTAAGRSLTPSGLAEARLRFGAGLQLAHTDQVLDGLRGLGAGYRLPGPLRGLW